MNFELRPISVCLAVAGLFVGVGCGSVGGGGDPLEPVPGEEDRANASSASITAEEAEDLGLTFSEDFLTRTLVDQCVRAGNPQNACECAGDAVTTEISPARFALVSLSPGPERQAMTRAVGNAIGTCVRTGSAPPSLGLNDIGTGDVEITPEGVDSLGLFKNRERVEELIVRDCESAGSDASACECFTSAVLDDLEIAEVLVIVLNGNQAFSTDYMTEVLAACS